ASVNIDAVCSSISAACRSVLAKAHRIWPHLCCYMFQNLISHHLIFMTRDKPELRIRRHPSRSESVAAFRSRKAAAGFHMVNAFLPGELVDQLDAVRDSQGLSGRAPIIEEALRYYFENKHITQRA